MIKILNNPTVFIVELFVEKEIIESKLEKVLKTFIQDDNGVNGFSIVKQK